MFLHFVLIALLTTPPNYLWQQFLENTFPATCPSKKEKSNDGDGMAASEHENGGLNVANTAVKFLLEQSLGATANTVIFVVVMGMFKGLSITEIVLAVRNVSWCFLRRSFSGVHKKLTRSSLGRLAHDAGWIQNLASGHTAQSHDRTGREPYPRGESCGRPVGDLLQSRVCVVWIVMNMGKGSMSYLVEA